MNSFNPSRFFKGLASDTVTLVGMRGHGFNVGIRRRGTDTVQSIAMTNACYCQKFGFFIFGFVFLSFCQSSGFKLLSHCGFFFFIDIKYI